MKRLILVIGSLLILAGCTGTPPAVTPYPAPGNVAPAPSNPYPVK